MRENLVEAAAYDLGFITVKRMLEETDRSFQSAKNLPMIDGHFLNWYDTSSATAIRSSTARAPSRC